MGNLERSRRKQTLVNQRIHALTGVHGSLQWMSYLVLSCLLRRIILRFFFPTLRRPRECFLLCRDPCNLILHYLFSLEVGKI